SEQGERLSEVPLPEIGTVSTLTSRDQEAEVVYFGFESFISPMRVFSLNVKTGALSVWHETNVDIASDDFVTRQLFFRSKDGTKVPLFLSGRKALVEKVTADGAHALPLLLYAYGGFNIA